MTSDASSWPIFVISCRRSGATLVRYILDSHEDIACPPESKFVTGLATFLKHPQALEAVAQMGIPQAELLEELGSFTNAIMRKYADRRGKRRWADNTPSYHRILDFIDSIFGGRVQFVFVVRHPLDTIDSLYTKTSYSPLSYGDLELERTLDLYGTGRYGFAKFWTDVNERIYLFASSRPGRSHVVRYEDLVLDTGRSVERLCSFLGATYSSELVERAFLEQHDKAFYELQEAPIGRIDAGRIGKWSRWPEEETAALWLIVGTIAERLGYRKPARSAEPSWAP